MRRKHTSFVLALQAQPIGSRHAGTPWINDVTNPREGDLVNQRSPCVPHMDPWAHQSAQTASNTRVHREPTSGPTSQLLKESTTRGGPRGGQPTLGSAEPSFGRLIPGLHMVVPNCHNRGVSLHLTPVPVPINRRRGGKNRTTHLKTTSYLSLISSSSFLLGGGETSSNQEYECGEDLA
jgi:hypothetical protein